MSAERLSHLIGAAAQRPAPAQFPVRGRVSKWDGGKSTPTVDVEVLHKDGSVNMAWPLFLGSEVTPGLQASLIAAVERQCAKDERVQPGSVVCRIEVLDTERARVRLDVETVDGEALSTTVEAT